MRNFSFFLFLYLFLTQTLIAQNRFGIQAGPVWSNQTKKHTDIGHRESINTESVTGFEVGVFYKKKLRGPVSLLAEANFTQTGTKTSLFNLTLDGRGYRYKFNDKVGYINIPLLLQYELKRLSIGAGPGDAYKVFSKLDNVIEDLRTHTAPSYKDLDLGLNATLAYGLTPKLAIGARYYYGLTDAEPTDTWTIKNRYLSASLRYALW